MRAAGELTARMTTSQPSGPLIPSSAGSRADDLRTTDIHDATRLLRGRDAAALLAVSERKLWELAIAGEIPMVRFGRSVRYSVDDLRQWVDAHRKGASDAQ
jgi:excisionase family DNA binding protein